ncbi:DUF418 domain-containing protein [Corynebacterium callunae]|uniref:DUF418 domain-containing protein n=1 Tax=Corynebacterium callunae TaxID=1721 RepID=UPI00398293E1
MKLLCRGLLLGLLGVALIPFAADIQVVLIVMGVSMALLAWIPKICWNLQLIIFLLLFIAAGVQFQFSPSYSPYPMLIWMAYIVLGMLSYQVIIRRALKKIAGVNVYIFLSICAAVVAIVGFALRFSESLPQWANFNGYTGTAAEVLLSSAACWVLLALCLLGTPFLPRWLATPFAHFGSMPLTMYCLHVLSATYIQRYVIHESTLAAVISIVAGIVLAMLWKKFFTKGPLEWLMAWCTNLIVVSPQPPAQLRPQLQNSATPPPKRKKRYPHAIF